MYISDDMRGSLYLLQMIYGSVSGNTFCPFYIHIYIYYNAFVLPLHFFTSTVQIHFPNPELNLRPDTAKEVFFLLSYTPIFKCILTNLCNIFKL